MRHALGLSVDSVLEGHSKSPSGNCTGLFLMGPKMPSGSLRGSSQVRPPSLDFVSMPHHLLGDGPTL